MMLYRNESILKVRFLGGNLTVIEENGKEGGKIDGR
jgi:hypothetical protein